MEDVLDCGVCYAFFSHTCQSLFSGEKRHSQVLNADGLVKRNEAFSLTKVGVIELFCVHELHQSFHRASFPSRGLHVSAAPFFTLQFFESQDILLQTSEG